MYMWMSSCQRYVFPNSACHWCTSTTLPSRRVKPPGWFIHALTEMTISDPVKPVSTIGMPLAKCARGDSRSQPYT
jgi:hypothetical protein